MRFTLEKHFDATPDEVYAIISDVGFQEAKCVASAKGRHTFSVTPGPEGVEVQTERSFPTDNFPELVKAFVGPHLVVVEHLQWGASNGDGSRSASLNYHVKRAPVTLRGSVTLSPTTNGTVERVEADVKANVPLVGSRLEKAAEAPIRYALNVEADLVEAYLAT